MSTFAELAALPSPGLAVLVEVSTDYFLSTLSVSGVVQRWSTVAGTFASLEYSAGIASVGRHQRNLGADGLMTASTLSLVLDNTDGAFDWLTYRTTVESTVFKARFKVSVALFDPTNPSDSQVQQLGIFQPLDMPSRDESRVFLELADDALGDAADLTLTPSALDWLNHASTTSGNTPWASGVGSLGVGVTWAPGFDPVRPLPLAFGRVSIPLRPMVFGDLGTLPAAICCTTNTTLTPATPDAWLNGVYSDRFGAFPGSDNLAYLDRSPFSILKDGRSWRIWLVQFNLNAMRDSAWVMQGVLGGELGSGSSVNRKALAEAFFQRIGNLTCNMWPGSSFTYTAPPSGFTAVALANVTCADVARDLLFRYARTGVQIDSTSFDDVSAHLPAARAAVYVGDVGTRSSVQSQPTVVAEAGQLRGIIRGLCQAGGFDLATLANGAVRALANTATYAAYVGAVGASVQRIDEERIVEGSLRFRIPSQGQRWAPYNRAFIDFGDSAGYLTPGRNGPFDHASNISSWGRPFTRVIDAALSDVSQGIGDIWSGSVVGFGQADAQFPLESKVRPVVTFRYGLEALRLDLGDYFIMSATRGAQTTLLDTYTDAIWKVEALNFTPESGQVEVTAVWSSDLLTEIPFLLDDETLIVRADSSTYGGGGVTASVTNSKTVTFSGGNLNTAGVVAGDILVLMDGTEGATAFERNRGLAIDVINSATSLDTVESVMSAAGPVAVSTWKILKGHTTYPTSGANYSDGSRMYGKGADAKDAGVYSNGDAANRLTGG